MAIKGTVKNAARVVERVQLASGLYVADISDAVGVTSWDFRVGNVSEFTFPAVDHNRELMSRGLLREGVTLRWDGQAWQIAAVERDYKGDDIWLQFTARSRLARRLRNMTGPKTWEKATPEQVLSSLVKKAGGRAVVEPGAGRMRIRQSRNQSVLDLIGSIASDTGVEWVEHGNTFYVGTPWWAFKGNTNLPTWSARADGTVTDIGSNVLSVLNLSSRSSLDDRRNAAEASITVEAATGVKVRPWHRVDLSRADDADNGIWLVSDVTFDEVSGSADLSLQRPLKSSPKKASQGQSRTTDSALSAADIEPLKDSSYKDAPRPAGWSGRSVASILSLYNNNRGGLNHPIYNGCLWYAQEAAGYPHIGMNPHVLWVMLATSKRHTSRTVVPGAVLLYRTSRIGHATVYLGGGKVLGTDMDESGRYAPGKWSIASADACEASFGTLIGWYSP